MSFEGNWQLAMFGIVNYKKLILYYYILNSDEERIMTMQADKIFKHLV